MQPLVQATTAFVISPLRTAVTGAIVLVIAVCGWFAAGVPPFGVEANVVTFSAAAAILGASAALARLRRPAPAWRESGLNLGQPGPTAATGDTSWRLAGLVAWLLAALFVVAVELWELFHAPRSAYPTLSSLANEVLGPGHRVARAAAFLCWGLCGLVVGRRPGRRS
ncbi:MAG: hypothetical protein ACLPUG_10185 [Acidimicrobiales bacterium]